MGLGDLLFSLPVLRVLKRNFPAEPLTFLTHENNASILSLVPEIDSCITYRSKSPAALLQLIRKVRAPRFSKVFVLNPIARGSLIAWISGAPERIGLLRDFERQQSLHGLENVLLTRAYVPKEMKRHEVDRYLDLLENYGLEIREEDRIPALKIPPGLLSEYPLPVRGSEKNAIMINLGAGWKNRLWPQERMICLSQALLREGCSRLYFCGGSTETQAAEFLLKQLDGRGVNLCGKTTLPQLSAYLTQCNLFITSDTGSLHIASALHIPVVALFGPGDLEKVRPRSAKTEVLYHVMPCSPCRFQYTSLCGENLCMKEISVEEVFEAAQRALGSSEATVPQLRAPALKTKKRILYLQSTSEVGGTDVTLLRTLEALDKKRFEAHVLQPKEGPFSNAYRAAGCKIHLFPKMKKMTRRKGPLYLFEFLFGYVPAAFGIAELIRKEQIDLVHTNTMHNLYGFLAAKIAGVPHVWHIREIVMQSSWMKKIEVFLVKRFSTKFVVMDNAISEMFLDANHGYPENIVKLYDGVDLQKFHPAHTGMRIRKDLNLSPEIPLIGTVGRLDPWKGLDLLVDTAKIVHTQAPKAVFLFCGGEIEGHEGYETKLREKIKKLGLEKSIVITGWKYFGPDIPEVYRALDLSVQCPQFPEPYGLANIEAMASGIPTVAVREGGPVELCVAGETGLLTEPGSAQALADAILKLLQDPELRKKMGKTGRARAESLFDYQICTRNLEALYADILGAQKS